MSGFWLPYECSSPSFAGPCLKNFRVGRPASVRELALLKAYSSTVRDDVLAGTWTPPATDGSGRDRETLKRALAL